MNSKTPNVKNYPGVELHYKPILNAMGCPYAYNSFAKPDRSCHTLLQLGCSPSSPSEDPGSCFMNRKM